MQIVERVKAAGVVGAGGAGFPTHVKINTKAGIVIANGAECEPLLRVDRMMMEHYPADIVRGMRYVVEATGAQKGVICLKRHYEKAVEALSGQIKKEPDISLHLMKSYYPAGDEQQMVYDVTGRVVPTGGLPIHVGAVVCNVSTLINIARAQAGKPVTHKHLTVTGEVGHPRTINAPVGASLIDCIRAADGPLDMDRYAVIIGGPAMGYCENDLSAPITKTTGGIIVLPKDHPHVKAKTASPEVDYKLAKAVCCQCNYCTQLCPRNALGLKVEPHKAMRAVEYGGIGLGKDINGIFSCCDCGLCSYYACDFGLKPSLVMTNIKNELLKKGVKPVQKVAGPVAPNRDITKVPVARFIARLGLTRYDVDAPLDKKALAVKRVRIPLKMHIGAQASPIVQKGQRVEAGALIAETGDRLGANIHASIGGVVRDVKDGYIEIAG
jgi:Na+-translocating ferredoxin:NAD+ oxidoreductase RnfC subunit